MQKCTNCASQASACRRVLLLTRFPMIPRADPACPLRRFKLASRRDPTTTGNILLDWQVSGACAHPRAQLEALLWVSWNVFLSRLC